MTEAASADERDRIVVFGEAMLRLGPVEGRRLEEPGNLSCDVAGSEMNVAYALARLGVSVSWLGALPDSPLGRRVEHELLAAGVDLTYLIRVSDARMGLFFAEVGAGPRPGRVYYDRAGSAFTMLRRHQLDLSAINGAWGVVISGITPGLGGASAELARSVACAAELAGARLCVDVNYRSLLWNADAARRALTELLAQAAVAVCGERDAKTVFGLRGPAREVARAFASDLAPRAELVVITQGDRGCTFAAGGATVHQPAVTTEIVDSFGVGDAFLAGLLWKLVRGADFSDAVRAASVTAAIKGTIRGDLARVTPGEVEAAIAGGAEALVR